MLSLLRNLITLPWLAPWGYTLMVYFSILNATALLMVVNPFGNFSIQDEPATFAEFWFSGAAVPFALLGSVGVVSVITLLRRNSLSRWSGFATGAVYGSLSLFGGEALMGIVLLAMGLVATLYFFTDKSLKSYYSEFCEEDSDDQSLTEEDEQKC